MIEKTHLCEFCDSDQPQSKKRVTVTRYRNGQWFIFEDVPAWVCPNCGHRYFDADVIESMERHMTAPPAGVRQVTAWAMSLSEKTG
jgi:YgiT-type zinc finger domain-containing protein